MPVGWGGSPGAEEMTGDLAQYTKYFALHDLDFDIMYRSGLWSVTVWGKREIPPVKVRNVKVMDDTDGGFHWEYSTLTHLRDFVATSESRATLDEALQQAYQAVKVARV
jgi:hypothetical protein